MILRQLEYIVAIDEYRNFTKASDFCCVTQPTISCQVKALEDYVGFPIFIREHGIVTPTQKGQLFLEKARLIVQEYRELQQISKVISKEADFK